MDKKKYSLLKVFKMSQMTFDLHFGVFVGLNFFLFIKVYKLYFQLAMQVLTGMQMKFDI